MAKINQIEKAIQELEGGAFQKLSDSYLLKKGYTQINPIGSVIGNNKVRVGTPDTLIPMADGKYIFAEYTTTVEKNIFKKFCDDIDKCLDESKTGILIDKIKEIVLCYTTEFSPKQIEQLREKCGKHSIICNPYSIGTISFDLLEKYPDLAKDYLGIEVDTGQIVELDRFISLYEKSKLATTLAINFYFRKEEISDFHEVLKNSEVVIISGQAGIGKTRFTIECYKQFLENNRSCKAYCIYNLGADLFDDVKSYFSDSGDYLIFIDDANRISGFQYIIQLLKTKRDDQNFKIIVTVRDYALDKIKGFCAEYEQVAEINLKPLTNDEIKKIVKDEFEINNPLYLDRIINIAQGNPRIAVMAAKIAKESNTLQSINDVSELYDSYYSSIKSDLDALGNEKFLKVAGIVAFFRTIDRTNLELMSDIEIIFNISPDDFWEATKKLHDMEIMDLFENEVVKISDQVLATYIFYLVFFKEKTLDFYILINDLFPQFKRRLVDALNPVLSAFNLDKTKKVLQPAVDKSWHYLSTNNIDNFIQLLDVFWFLKPTETLIFIQEQIEIIDKHEIDIKDILFETKSNSTSTLPSFLSSLAVFRYREINEVNNSLELFLQFVEKQPQLTSEILRIFVDQYGFQPDSYQQGYKIQYCVIEKILKKSNAGKNEYFSRIFIALAENYLHTHFSATTSSTYHSITITQFDLAETTELLRLRKLIWNNLFDFYHYKYLKQNILDLLLRHSQSGLDTSVGRIIEEDSKMALKFFKKNLDPSNLYHCIIVQKYLKHLNRFELPFPENIITEFRSDNYELYTFISNRFEKIELKLTSDDYIEYKKNKIKSLFNHYTVDDYSGLLNELNTILSITGENSKWEIDRGIDLILEELSSRNANLYCDVIKAYLQKGEFLNLSSWNPVKNIILSTDSETVFEILTKPVYQSKNRWLFSYYQHLPKEDIRNKHLDALKELFATAEITHFLNYLDYLLKYESIENGFIVKVVQIILERIKDEPSFARALVFIFYRDTKINEQLLSLFSSHSILLEEAYITSDQVDKHNDYDGSSFSKLLDNDPDFINRYLENKFSGNDYIDRYGENRDYSFIWHRDDFLDIMKRISEVILKNEKKIFFFRYFELFFNKKRNDQTDGKIIKRQDMFLSTEISNNSEEIAYMNLLFSVITGFEAERKLNLYHNFLEVNEKFDDFKHLIHNSSGSDWIGSKVPILQEKIDFYELLIPTCNSVKFLKHKGLIEQMIKYLRQEIQEEKKRDFTEEWQ